MTEKDNDFLKRLLATFEVEAREHVSAMSSGLIELEHPLAAEKQMEIVEAVFREAHSLKGAARAINAMEIEAICQSLESVFSTVKRKDLVLSPALFDLLHQAVDTLGILVVSVRKDRTSAEKAQLIELVHGLEKTLQGGETGSQEPKDKEFPSIPHPEPLVLSPELRSPTPILAETIRISTARLDSLFLQAEELLSAKMAARQRLAELQDFHASLAVWKKEWTKLRNTEYGMRNAEEKNLQSPIRNPQWQEFLTWNDNDIKSLDSKLLSLTKSAEQDHRTLSRMLDDLLGDMKKALMLPFSSLLEIFPKLVRDLSRDRGKEVELVMQGGESEIDRRILEEMKDPLIHIVRNCVDHGIEPSQERVRKQKFARGTVTITIATKNGSRVEIIVADDGAGIDAAQVWAAASKLGMVRQEDVHPFNEQKALSLIFQSGVSTSPMITDISGRGLGLAIVREKVEKLGGVVSVETYPDVGTTFRIALPLTLTTFRGILVRLAERLFVLPTTHVERVVRVHTAEIKTVENRETIPLDGQAVALVRLADVLELPKKNATADSVDKMLAVVLSSAEKRLAFLVDEVLDEQEVLVKSLGTQLSRVRNIAGATILGTGRVVPILNVPDLVKSAVRTGTGAVRAAATPEDGEAAKRKSILVVEDSITARTLLKGILEAAGYDVVTAVDGIDGFTQLRSGQFDLVVSDVDMPRMNGFALTARIRDDKKLAEVPVVLVTALESREDRERGIEVGANAYIVKSRFDQSNLLEVIRRLI